MLPLLSTAREKHFTVLRSIKESRQDMQTYYTLLLFWVNPQTPYPKCSQIIEAKKENLTTGLGLASKISRPKVKIKKDRLAYAQQ